jgi:hypothetical protein
LLDSRISYQWPRKTGAITSKKWIRAVWYQHFGGMYCFHHQFRKISQAITKEVSTAYLLPIVCWLLGLRFDTEDRCSKFVRNVWKHQNTWLRIPEDRAVCSHRCESLKPQFLVQKTSFPISMTRVSWPSYLILYRCSQFQQSLDLNFRRIRLWPHEQHLLLEICDKWSCYNCLSNEVATLQP